MNSRGRVVSVASLAMTLRLKVPDFPQRGSAVLAHTTRSGVGGAFEMLAAARIFGGEVINLCPLGTGPNSMVMRQELRRHQIGSEAIEMVGDIGLTLVLMEDSGYYTSVITPGIESDLELVALSGFAAREGDHIYVSAGDLVYEPYRTAVTAWLRGLPRGVRVMLAASSLVGGLRAEWLRDILPLVDVFSANATEADEVAALLGCPLDSAEFLAQLRGPDAVAVIRNGAQGARLISVDAPAGVVVPSLDYDVVDTLGVGATHTGVLLAALAQGQQPIDALRRANVAGAIAVSRAGGSGNIEAAEIERLAASLA